MDLRRLLPSLFRCGILLLCLIALPALAAQAPSARYALTAPAARYTIETAAVERDAELAADTHRPRFAPLRYAATRVIPNVTHTSAGTQGGEWRELPGDMLLWRIPVRAANALSLDFVFRRFFLPPRAQLYIRGADATLGPYTDADNPRSRVFATPLIKGASATVEVLLPRAMRPFLELQLDEAHAGYRELFGVKSLRNPNMGSGACNIDTICHEGDAWRAEINAAAALVSGGVYCSGQLVNNTRGDRAPLLATAAHCFSTADAGDALVVYWKYESAQCRAIGSLENALPVSSASAIAQTGGADLLATDTASDVTLLRLRTAPPPDAGAYFNGWDRDPAPFSGGAVIHHPHADAKRISLIDVNILPTEASMPPGQHHWHVERYLAGTTEDGSSGSGLLDANHHLRGVLSDGLASCDQPDGDDYYGRIDTAWIGGGTSSTGLADWLDPLRSDAMRVDGIAACAVSVTLNASADTLLVGDRITLSASATGGAAPYRYAFDVDGDGITDTTDPSQSSTPVVYPDAYTGNVSVHVTDANGCVGAATRALIVQAPKIVLTAAPVVAPQPLCGGNANAAIEPGQRWRQTFVLSNSGNAASQAGWAIFAQDPATLAQTHLTLENPAIALPTLAPGQATSLKLDYAIDANNACGAPITINLLGTADTKGFYPAPAVAVSGAISAACEAVTTCPAMPVTPRLDSNAYFDPLRPGTGMALASLSAGSADPLVFALWFSADASREPTWYQLQAPRHGNQVNSPLYHVQQSVPYVWPTHPQLVGSAQITPIADNSFVYSWSLDGRVGGALYQPVTTQPSSISILYNPSESGWGLYRLRYSGLDAALIFLYDAAGNPRWVETSSKVSGPGYSTFSLRPACPGCVWLDYNAGRNDELGSFDYSTSGTQLQLSTNLVFPALFPGSWLRTQLPLTPLYQSP